MAKRELLPGEDRATSLVRLLNQELDSTDDPSNPAETCANALISWAHLWRTTAEPETSFEAAGPGPTGCCGRRPGAPHRPHCRWHGQQVPRSSDPTIRITDLDPDRDADHALEALRRVAHALGVDSPIQLRHSSNKRIAELCTARVRELEDSPQTAKDLKAALVEAIELAEMSPKQWNDTRDGARLDRLRSLIADSAPPKVPWPADWPINLNNEYTTCPVCGPSREVINVRPGGDGLLQCVERVDEMSLDVRTHRPGDDVARPAGIAVANRAVKAVRWDGRDARQRIVTEWAREAFGNSEATSLRQRGIRLLEEAIEAFQACCGVSGPGTRDEEIAHELVAYVFKRPAGEVAQELGGVAVTALALAAAAGVSADEEECREINRVLGKPIEHFTKRNANKNAAGFKVDQTPAPTETLPDLPDLLVDPRRVSTFGIINDRDGLGGVYRDTGIYVRARTHEGAWGNHDIAELDTQSLLAWLRFKQAGDETVAMLLGHGPALVPRTIHIIPDSEPATAAEGDAARHSDLLPDNGR